MDSTSNEQARLGHGPFQPRTKKRTPTYETMEMWVAMGVARATDGCRVEPDGSCPHGKPSWLIELGFI
jgi:hypothetical protein